MKAILSRLFNHEELTRKEAKNLLLNITRGMYNDAQNSRPADRFPNARHQSRRIDRFP